MSAATITALLAELHHADHIINVMLNAMTLQQKAKVHEQLESAGVSPGDMTRANERHAVIEAAGACSKPSMINVAAIRQHASDIGAHGARLEILLLTIFDRLEEIDPKDRGTRAAVDAVECFTTCALRNGVLMREAAGQVEALALEGGAA